MVAGSGRLWRGLSVTIILVVTFVARSAAAKRLDPAYESALHEQLQALAPDAIAPWDRANEARERADTNAAQAAYREVVAKAPTFDAGYRRLCSVQTGDEAIASCRRALALKASWENEASLAARLSEKAFTRGEARTLANSAEARAPSELTVLMVQAQISLADQNLDRFGIYMDRLHVTHPGDPDYAYLDVIAALVHADPELARRELARGVAAGTIPPGDALERMIDDYENRWTPMRIAKTFGESLVVWFLIALLLYAAGTWLSRATLRATEVSAIRSAQHPSDAVGGTRGIKRLYSALITAASIFYYASLPLVAALVLIGFFGTIYAFLAMGRIPIKLVLIFGLVGGASLWAILKGVFITLRPPKATDPGEEIRLAEHPKLAALLSAVSARIGTRSVDRVFLTPHTDMAVFERGGVFATTRARGERCLVLGAGLLRGMRVGSLKGVLAHEFGHFKNEDTAGGALSLAVRRSMMQMLVALIQGGAAKVYNPAWIFATRYHGLFLRISQGASRLQEVLADRWAVFAYGSRPFVEGFEHVIARTVEHDARVEVTLKDVIDNDRPLLNLFTHEAQIDLMALSVQQREARDRAPDPYDSHPPPKDRIAAALALAVEHSPEPGDEEDAWQLFEDRAALEQLLTARVCDAVAENHAVRIRRAPDAAPAHR